VPDLSSRGVPELNHDRAEDKQHHLERTKKGACKRKVRGGGGEIVPRARRLVIQKAEVVGSFRVRQGHSAFVPGWKNRENEEKNTIAAGQERDKLGNCTYKKFWNSDQEPLAGEEKGKSARRAGRRTKKTMRGQAIWGSGA